MNVKWPKKTTTKFGFFNGINNKAKLKKKDSEKLLVALIVI